ncbi:MAG: hypothetical protein QXF61_09415 [Nitrososphaeria archaeon]
MITTVKLLKPIIRCEVKICLEKGEFDEAFQHFSGATQSCEASTYKKNLEEILHKIYIQTRDLLRAEIDKEENEEKRRYLRERIVEWANKTAGCIDHMSWRFYEIKGDEKKFSGIIEKAKGNYDHAIELLDNAIKYYNEALKCKQTEKADKIIKGHIKYCEALKTEVFAQQKYLNGKIKEAADQFQKASNLYGQCKDKRSQNWCTFLHTFLEALLMILTPSSKEKWIEGINLLKKALGIMPREYQEEIESLKSKIMSGGELPEDKKLMTFFDSVSVEFQKRVRSTLY